MTVTVEKVDAAMLGTVRNYGDQALLLEFNSTAEVLAWTDTLRAASLPGVLDIVPASRTILIKLASPRYQVPTGQRLSELHLVAPENAGTSASMQPDVVIDVVYDGMDLDEVVRLKQLTGLAALFRDREFSQAWEACEPEGGNE